MRQLFVGLVAEGTTDIRFLKNVIHKSIQELSWECSPMVDVSDVWEIVGARGDSFVEKMLDASKKAQHISLLCIHADADDKSAEDVLTNKFIPFYKELNKLSDSECCKAVVPTIPIRMIESWMLANKQLLKQLIDAVGKSDVELGIERPPESYANPKETIEEAIRISLAGKVKRRRDQVRISDLYEILGNELSLEYLRKIPSFKQFEYNVKQTLKALNFLR